MEFENIINSAVEYVNSNKPLNTSCLPISVLHKRFLQTDQDFLFVPRDINEQDVRIAYDALRAMIFHKQHFGVVPNRSNWQWEIYLPDGINALKNKLYSMSAYTLTTNNEGSMQLVDRILNNTLQQLDLSMLEASSLTADPISSINNLFTILFDHCKDSASAEPAILSLIMFTIFGEYGIIATMAIGVQIVWSIIRHELVQDKNFVPLKGALAKFTKCVNILCNGGAHSISTALRITDDAKKYISLPSQHLTLLFMKQQLLSLDPDVQNVCYTLMYNKNKQLAQLICKYLKLTTLKAYLDMHQVEDIFTVPRDNDVFKDLGCLLPEDFLDEAVISCQQRCGLTPTKNCWSVKY